MSTFTVETVWWWTVDVDQDGQQITKKTKTHVLVHDTQNGGSITLCGIDPGDEPFESFLGRYDPNPCKRCARTHVGKWVLRKVPRHP
jgi:hypothetical protein